MDCFARLDPATRIQLPLVGAPAIPRDGYYVYRETQFSGPIKLTPQIIVGTQYVDKSVEAGHNFPYFVTSVDSRGLESKPSDKIVPSPSLSSTGTPACALLLSPAKTRTGRSACATFPQAEARAYEKAHLYFRDIAYKRCEHGKLWLCRSA